jgi:hypothetical protein
MIRAHFTLPCLYLAQEKIVDRLIIPSLIYNLFFDTFLIMGNGTFMGHFTEISNTRTHRRTKNKDNKKSSQPPIWRSTPFVSCRLRISQWGELYRILLEAITFSIYFRSIFTSEILIPVLISAHLIRQ